MRGHARLMQTDHVYVDTMHRSCSGSCEALNERERESAET